MEKTVAERFLEKVGPVTDAGCREWLSTKSKAGYGQFKHKGKHLKAHRVSYEFYKGEILFGLVVMHSCDNPTCVNPEHLSLGTPRDNTLDSVKKGRKPKGEKHVSARLTEERVAWIRAALAEGLPQSKVAEAVGISQSQVSRIYLNKTWKKNNNESNHQHA